MDSGIYLLIAMNRLLVRPLVQVAELNQHMHTQPPDDSIKVKTEGGRQPGLPDHRQHGKSMLKISAAGVAGNLVFPTLMSVKFFFETATGSVINCKRHSNSCLEPSAGTFSL